MSKSERFGSTGSEVALSASGILVTALVGALLTYSVSETSLFIPTAALAATQLGLVTYSLFAAQERTGRIAFWLEALCISALLFLVRSDDILVLSIVWLVQAVEYFGIRRAAQLLLATQVLFVVTQLIQFADTNWLQVLISVFLFSMLQLFAISVSQRVINERDQRQQMAALNRELLATRELLSQSAAQNERLRIARDLHDILGHHMTALILNLEIASHTIEGQPKDKVEQSLALAKLLLSELRSTVSDLRDDSPLNLEESVRKLVTDIPNIDVTVDFSSAPTINDMDMAETFLRCAQEAVTNVLRHSNADRCQISMSGNDADCTLVIRDNGSSYSTIEPGNGLTGMRERVEDRGGELNWQKDDKGFQLQITLRAEASA